jgi:hypothetical protein
MTTPGPASSGPQPGMGRLIGALSSVACGLLACVCMALMWVLDKQLFPVRPDGIGGLFEAILFSPLAIGFVGLSAVAIFVGMAMLVIRPSLLAAAGLVLGIVPWVGLYYSPAGQEYAKARRIDTAQNAQVFANEKELTEFVRAMNSTTPVSLVISDPGYPITCFAKPKQTTGGKQTLWGECHVLELHGEVLIDPVAPSALTLHAVLEDSLHPGARPPPDTDVSRAPTSRLSLSAGGDLVTDKTAGALHGSGVSATVDQVFGTGIRGRSVQIGDATFHWVASQGGSGRIADASFTFDLDSYEQRPAITYVLKLKVAWH